MTDDTLKVLRDLLAKATPGPWTITTEDDRRDGLNSRLLHAGRHGMLAIIRTEHQGGYFGSANAELIAALRNAAPDLLDTIERLTRERARNHDELDRRFALIEEKSKRVAELEEALRELLTAEKLDDDNPRLVAAREQAARALAGGADDR